MKISNKKLYAKCDHCGEKYEYKVCGFYKKPGIIGVLEIQMDSENELVLCGEKVICPKCRDRYDEMWRELNEEFWKGWKNDESN